MAYETILYEKQNGVATITLNRPQSLNAFVPQMNKEVLEALKDGERDKEVRCFMITGAGRAFCAGQDLKGRTPEQKGSLGASLREKYNPMIRQIRQHGKDRHRRGQRRRRRRRLQLCARLRSARRVRGRQVYSVLRARRS